jgi:hypothetical protein
MRDHPNQRLRVKDRLEDHVLGFIASVGIGGTFFGRDLVSHCMQRAQCSPSSPDRILRLLATEEPVRVAYEVLDRRRSLYVVRGCWPEGRPVERCAQLSLLGVG